MALPYLISPYLAAPYWDPVIWPIITSPILPFPLLPVPSTCTDSLPFSSLLRFVLPHLYLQHLTQYCVYVSLPVYISRDIINPFLPVCESSYHRTFT